MHLILSFSAMLRHLSKIDFTRDLFFFGCHADHVLGEPRYGQVNEWGSDAPWSEWVASLQRDAIDPKCVIEPVRERILLARSTGRIGFAKGKGTRSISTAYSRLACLLLKFQVIDPEQAAQLANHDHPEEYYCYPRVAELLGERITCLY